jgi:polysaccharide chain length determinant protein (PEP-CTERM system associated)
LLPGRTFPVADIVRILLRRGWLIVIPFAVGASLAPLISRTLPQLFRSETLIMVVPQQVPDTYVKSTVTAKMEDRLPSISNVILSRSRLERIINDFNLYPGQRSRGIMEDVVQRLRGDISVQVEGQDSFRLKYVSTDPQTAQKVAGRLASLYIEENLRDRANLADETNLFLESQLNDAKQRLIEHEKKLEAYRRKYAGQLPSQLESNLQTIRNTQAQLQAVNDSTNRIQERRLLVERQIADTQSLPIESAPVAPAAAVVDRTSAQTATATQQLEAAQAQLTALRVRYKPDHPDVRAMERVVRDLQAKADEEGRRPQATPPPAPVVQRVASPMEIAQQKRLRDLRDELEVVDHQLAVNQGEENRLKQVMAGYQSKVDVVPTRESELVELTRDYGTLQAAYMSLLAKREDSKIAANLERRQIGEQFRILDPASLPEKPYNQQQRLGMMAAGAAAGLVFGLVVVGFMEYRDSSLKREADVVRTLSLPVLALIPMMASEGERKKTQRRMWAMNIAAGIALLGSAAILALWRHGTL